MKKLLSVIMVFTCLLTSVGVNASGGNQMILKNDGCTHSDFTDTYSYTKYEQIYSDDESHTAVHFYNRTCNKCGVTFDEDLRGNEQTEAHKFSADTCTVCGYNKNCQHVKGTDYYVKTEYSRINGDYTYHNATDIYEKRCDKCGETIEENIKSNPKEEKHKYSGGKCTVCDMPKKEEVIPEKEISAKENQSAKVTFSDVSKNAYYAEAVNELVSKKIINGYENGEFRPQKTLTRAEAAVFLCKMNGNFSVSEADTRFSDVGEGFEWASGYINKAVKLGIVSGMGDGTYNPEGTLTAEQFITMIIRWLGLENNAQNRAGEYWADGYVKAAKDVALTDGVSIKNFSEGISRADASVIANKALKIKGKVKAEKLIFENKRVYTSADEIKGDVVKHDVDGLSFVLYTPKGNTGGIQTKISLKDVETNLYQGADYDYDNAYAYLCVNDSLWNGDYGFLKSGNGVWEIVTSDTSGWNIRKRNNVNHTIKVNEKYIKYSEAENKIEETGEYVTGWTVKDEQGYLEKSGNIQLDLMYKNGLLTFTVNFVPQGKSSYVEVFRYEAKCNINEKTCIFGRAASVTNSIENDKRLENTTLKNYKNQYYLNTISSSKIIKNETIEELSFLHDFRQSDENRTPAFYRNVVFFDTYYHCINHCGIGYHKLIAKDAERWIYPNKKYNNINTVDGIVEREGGTPIVKCIEYEKDGVTYNEIDFNNY